MKLIKIMLKIKCKMGLHDPRVYGYTEKQENVKMELYYTCLYCPYGFWDYLVNPPKEDMDNLSEYKFNKEETE